jgi:hypothetical protein
MSLHDAGDNSRSRVTPPMARFMLCFSIYIPIAALSSSVAEVSARTMCVRANGLEMCTSAPPLQTRPSLHTHPRSIKVHAYDPGRSMHRYLATRASVASNSCSKSLQHVLRHRLPARRIALISPGCHRARLPVEASRETHVPATRTYRSDHRPR